MTEHSMTLHKLLLARQDKMAPISYIWHQMASLCHVSCGDVATHSSSSLDDYK